MGPDDQICWKLGVACSPPIRTFTNVATFKEYTLVWLAARISEANKAALNKSPVKQERFISHGTL